MASSKEYLKYIMEQLSDLDEISYRAMMGEYIIYYRGRIVGGIYDNRFLVKPVNAALSMMPNADRELPYEGAKEMLRLMMWKTNHFLGGYLMQCMVSFQLQRKEKNNFEIM